jgi:hypothetical protein
MTCTRPGGSRHVPHPSLFEDWSECLLRRMRDSWLRLREWRSARVEPGRTEGERDDTHLWAEGPLPGRLAGCLSCGVSGTERRPGAAPPGAGHPRQDRLPVLVVKRRSRALH